MGRLEEQKDQITLIKAFSRIASQFPDWNLRIIGEGSLRSFLKNQIETLNLDDRIALPGATSEIDTEYANADIFVLPSLYESFGLVTAEAMSYGLPPIGFEDCPGTNELIQDGVNGILVNSSNRIRNLADAMVVLIENQKLRATLGEQGKLTMASFSPTIIFAKWENFLKEIVQSKE